MYAMFISYRFYVLVCYPFFDKDPFVLSEAPHVYFIGNQPKFETKILSGNFNYYSIFF